MDILSQGALRPSGPASFYRAPAMRIVMRFHFPNLDRPKKAAKRIACLLGGAPALSKVQNGLAVALGYRDWHELELAHASEPPLPLDQALPAEDFHRRSADLALKLAKALGVSDSEAQYALLGSRLTGDQANLADQFAIRMACWRIKGQWPSSGMAGTVARPRFSFSGPRNLVMLTADFDASQGRRVQFVGDNRSGLCMRDEISIPRTPLAPFIPYRLRLAYGVYTEFDGAKVLFSRDYAPMWRLRDGHPPQQVSPTTWIKHDHDRQEWFWDADPPWDDRRRIREEEERLASFGIAGLPALVDLLPVMVSSTGNVQMPRRVLESLRK
jgi:hypothetical protein